ncbi:MAG: ribosome silencing factor [Clostridiales bacterium]|nr:MAG: ribosome silencing factor [Clostridiales bacterium]
MTIEKMVKTAVKALDSKKAVDIKVIKVDSLTTLADYFIICNGTSTTQVRALADECEFQLEEAGFKILHREGKDAGNWILLDYKDIIVHVYNKELREHYDLERFWADGEEIDISGFLEE